jgi:hypothetical protein
MSKGNGAGGIVAMQTSPSKHKQDMTAAHDKREFLKRKTEKSGSIASGRPPSRYKYYADNFKS